MDITPFIPAGKQVIDGYAPGRFGVAGVWRAGAVIVLPDRTLEWDAPVFADLAAADFQAVVEADPAVDLLLLGGGQRAQLLPSAIRRELRAAGVVVELMDSGAACRTFNVLLAEGRRVAAALYPV